MCLRFVCVILRIWNKFYTFRILPFYLFWMNYNVWFRWMQCFIYTYRTVLLSAMILADLICLLSICCFLFLFLKFLVCTWIHLLPTHRSLLNRSKRYNTTISVFGLLYHLRLTNFHLIITLKLTVIFVLSSKVLTMHYCVFDENFARSN
jgi:hypothetical protein